MKTSEHKWIAARKETMNAVEVCEHEWMVYPTAMAQVFWMMLECEKCRALGTIQDPTKAEWSVGLRSPSKSYRWHDNNRVVIIKSGF